MFAFLLVMTGSYDNSNRPLEILYGIALDESPIKRVSIRNMGNCEPLEQNDSKRKLATDLIQTSFGDVQNLEKKIDPNILISEAGFLDDSEVFAALGIRLGAMEKDNPTKTVVFGYFVDQGKEEGKISGPEIFY